MPMYKPNKFEKPVVFIDLKTGEWTVDTGPLQVAITRGLGAGGMAFIKSLLGKAYKQAQKDLKEKGK